MYEEEDFQKIDPLLTPWANEHHIKFDRLSKGYAVRSIWIQHKVQLWIDAPDTEGYVRVHLAELKQELPSKWGRKLEWRTTQGELVKCLDELLVIGNRWL